MSQKQVPRTSSLDIYAGQDQPGDPSAKNARRAGSAYTQETAQDQSMMPTQLIHSVDGPDVQTTNASPRKSMRSAALQNALEKRAAGVPTYTVPEAAALLSISPEYLYRLVQADAFPAVQMGIAGRGRPGRYVVPAKALDHLLAAASDSATCLDVGEWTREQGPTSAGGAA